LYVVRPESSNQMVNGRQFDMRFGIASKISVCHCCRSSSIIIRRRTRQQEQEDEQQKRPPVAADLISVTKAHKTMADFLQLGEVTLWVASFFYYLFVLFSFLFLFLFFQKRTRQMFTSKYATSSTATAKRQQKS